jgi:hypothetical protein
MDACGWLCIGVVMVAIIILVLLAVSSNMDDFWDA